jgi:hypothetical protein
MALAYLIRIFSLDLPLLPAQSAAQNSPTVRHSRQSFISKRPVHRKLSIEESNMNKMAIFLGGFLTLTILIGLLATISPV